MAFKVKPTSAPKAAPVKRSTTATLNALATFLAYEEINPGRRARVERTEDVSSLVLKTDLYFPGNPSVRPADIGAALRKAQDQGKSSAKKAAPRPSQSASPVRRQILPYPPSSGHVEKSRRHRFS